MSILVRKINELSHRYVRSGSKENRRLQIGRIIKFVEFIEETEKLHGLQEIGKRHVIEFWKSNREFADKTANDYWLALCILWKLVDKAGAPPKPLIFSKQESRTIGSMNPNDSGNDTSQSETIALLNELASAIKLRRLSRNISIDEVSRATGLDHKTISDIEAGDESCRYIDVEKLLNFANLKFKQVKV